MHVYRVHTRPVPVQGGYANHGRLQLQGVYVPVPLQDVQDFVDRFHQPVAVLGSGKENSALLNNFGLDRHARDKTCVGKSLRSFT